MLDDNACDVVYMFMIFMAQAWAMLYSMLMYMCGKGGWALSVNWTRRGNTHVQYRAAL